MLRHEDRDQAGDQVRNESADRDEKLFQSAGEENPLYRRKGADREGPCHDPDHRFQHVLPVKDGNRVCGKVHEDEKEETQENVVIED